MAEPIIKVRGLSKQFVISHEAKENYTSLRDTISRYAKQIVSGSTKKKGIGAYKEDFWALQDIDFDVQQGDRVGIIGRNGAGKSTLLKLLSRISEPTRGRIDIRGRVASLLEVGTGFHPELTGRENIFLNGAILGMSRAEIRRKFDEIVAFAEVEQFLDTPVKRYSSGMYVRLAFAVAAHLEPEILIVDEVLAVGDAQFQKKCLGKMEDVSRNEGRTVLFVSHNMKALTSLCKTGIYLKGGKLVAFDEINRTIDTYLQQSESNTSFREWSAQKLNKKSDKDFNLLNILIRQDSREVFGNVVNGKDIDIEIQYELRNKLNRFRVFLDVCDIVGSIVFRSFHDEDNDDFIQMDAGVYTSRMTIPANLLAPISYDLKFLFGIHNIRMVQPEEGVTIRINVEQTGSYNRGYNGQYTGGMISPTLHWTIERIK